MDARNASPTTLDSPRTDAALDAPPVPGVRTAGASLVAFLACVAVGETVLGDLDQTDNFAAMTAEPWRLTTGGLILLAGAMLLGVAVAGLARLVWPTVLGKVATVLLAIAVPCGGAFAMFHLALAETVAEGLDPAAMEQFVLQRTSGPGAWGLPVLIFAVGGFLALVLLLTALARQQLVSWRAPSLLVVALVADNVGDGAIELAALWLAVVAGLVAAVGLWRATTVRRP